MGNKTGHNRPKKQPMTFKMRIPNQKKSDRRLQKEGERMQKNSVGRKIKEGARAVELTHKKHRNRVKAKALRKFRSLTNSYPKYA